MAQNELEKIAIQKRKELISKNVYNSSADEQNYSAMHTRALSDTETPNHGKGTGKYLDTTEGGSNIDINGNPEAPGSGRVKNIATNEYNQDNDYDTPDMTGNVGQITI
jgi:hypothetical protein